MGHIHLLAGNRWAGVGINHAPFYAQTCVNLAASPAELTSGGALLSK